MAGDEHGDLCRESGRQGQERKASDCRTPPCSPEWVCNLLNYYHLAAFWRVFPAFPSGVGVPYRGEAESMIWPQGSRTFLGNWIVNEAGLAVERLRVPSRPAEVARRPGSSRSFQAGIRSPDPRQATPTE